LGSNQGLSEEWAKFESMIGESFKEKINDKNDKKDGTIS
jgi:hypothetical protein